jgi:hypothetical protein
MTDYKGRASGYGSFCLKLTVGESDPTGYWLILVKLLRLGFVAHVAGLLGLGCAFAQQYVAIPGSATGSNATTDAAGNTYTYNATSLIKIAPGGTQTTLASASPAPASQGTYQQGSFRFTSAVVDSSGNVYAAESPTAGTFPTGFGTGEVIVKVTPAGVVTTTNLAIASNNYAIPNCVVTVDGNGDVFTIAPDYSIVELKANGSTIVIQPVSGWMSYAGTIGGSGPAGVPGSYPTSLYADSAGDVFASGAQKYAPNGVTGSVINGGNVEFLALTSTPVFLTQTASATAVTLGGAVNFTVSSIAATSAGSLSYQWYLNGVPIAGGLLTQSGLYQGTYPVTGATTSIFQITAAQLSNAGNYTVVVTGSSGSATSAPFPLSITVGQVSINPFPQISQAPTGGIITPGSSLTLTASAVSSLPVAFQWYWNGSIIQGATNASASSTYLYTTSYAASQAGVYTVVATSAGAGGGSAASTGATVTVQTPAGVTVVPTPTITTNVSNGTAIYANGVVTPINLSIAAVASLPLSYQWYLNGTAIVGATSSVFGATTAGVYTVVVSTAAGSVTSQPATVTVTSSSGASVANIPIIITQPQGGNIVLGGTPSTAVLSVSAAALLPLGYQWALNGTAISGATNATFVATAAGSYTVTVSTAAGSVVSQVATVAATTSSGVPVGAAPVVVSQPQGRPLVYGGGQSTATLSVSAAALLPLTYQWYINGVSIPGATASTYTATVAGAYVVTVTSDAGSVTTAPAVVVWGDRLINVSSRATISRGAPATAGFVITSLSGASKQVLIRAVGPGLSAFGVSSPLPHPSLTVYNANGTVVASDTGWTGSSAVTAADSAAGAFPLQPGSADSALVLTLGPGAYTAQASTADGSTGEVLIETYELSADSTRLINLSTLATVTSGANGPIIGGLVTSGTQPSQVLIRAVGPALTAFGVSGALAQPILSVYNANGVLVGVNGGWSNGANAASVAAAATATGAFTLQPGSTDSALLLTLAPGAYTARIDGANGTAGAALLEFYLVPGAE